MPGPLGVIAPTTDPNWAWDVIGWTNQANTADTESTGTPSPGGTTVGWLATPPAVPATTVYAVNPSGLTAAVTLLTTGTLTTPWIQIKDAVGTAKTVVGAPPAIGATFLVPPNGAIAWTGSAAPTWAWQLIN